KRPRQEMCSPKKPSMSLGTSSIAMPGRSPGGSPRSGDFPPWWRSQGATEEEIKILKSVLRETARESGEGLLIVDDLADTGATIKLVRATLPKAHVATVYAKPLGRPFVDTFITEVTQDTWIYFPWDLGLSFQAPIAGSG